MSTNFKSTGTGGRYKRFLCAVLACIVMMSTIFTGDITVKAQSEQEATAPVASPSDPDEEKSGLVRENDGYRYYIKDIAQTGGKWIKMSDREVYVGKTGYVERVYYTSTQRLKIVKGLESFNASNMEDKLSNGYNYLFDKNGIRIKKSGWYTVKNCKYYAAGKGILTQKYVKSGNTIKLYSDNSGKGQWKIYKKTWRAVDGQRLYFGPSGVCTRIYYPKQRRLKVLMNGNFVLARNMVFAMDNGMEYYFNANGVREKKSGWHKSYSGQMVYVNSSSRVIGKVIKRGGTYRFYKVDSTGKRWVLQKNKWLKDNSRLYYFAGNGCAKVVYDISSKRLYTYSGSSRKYVPVKNKLYKLNGKAYYFYNSKGVRTTSKGWKKADSHTLYYIGSKGYMTSKYVESGSRKYMYNYNYSTGKWVPQKNKWCKIRTHRYFFNSKGMATIDFAESSQKVYVLSKGKWTSVKNSIQKVGSANYFFDRRGVRVKKAGVYKTANGYLAYVNRKGVVYKRAYNLEVERYYKIDLGNGRSTYVYGYYDLGAASKLMAEVNAHRNENGLASLEISSTLTDTATTRAIEISNTTGHVRPNGTLCINSMYELYGENLAYGFSEESLAFRAWTKSSDHERNMLDTSYKTMGAAVFIALERDNQGYKRYYVLTFGK